MNHWLIFIPLAPLIGAILIGLFGRRLPGILCAWLATFCVFISALIVLTLWLGLDAFPLEQSLYRWVGIGPWNITLGLKFDQVTLVMSAVASVVGFLIHLFSVGYMKDEQGIRRYFFYLNLFVAGMLFFVLADNLILLYLGWEVMGLCSYALVSFYYQKQYNAYCGRKAFVVTRIGDTALVLAIVLLFAQLNSFNISFILHSIPSLPLPTLSIVALLLVLAAIAKSAQFPFHIWLPDAMTGPSPVSALIHAATMVTAGVYLITRFHGIFDEVLYIRYLVGAIGVFTAFYAASAALAQVQIKRVLAYSTISQIGYMFAGLGVGAYSFALFHLMVHACFKALLFMGSGIIADSYKGSSNLTKMGGLRKKQPLFHLFYLIACLALAALPIVTASFYSKDAIIASTYTGDFPYAMIVFGLAGSIMTGIYSMRLYLMVFRGEQKAPIEPMKLPWRMQIPLGILAVASILLGFIQLPSDWSFGPHLLVPWLASVVGLPPEPNSTVLFLLELAGSGAAILGIALAFWLVRSEQFNLRLGNFRFLNSGWFMDSVLGGLVIKTYSMFVRVALDIEKYVLNRFFIGTLSYFLVQANRALSVQKNQLFYYLCYLVFGVILLLGFVMGIV